MSDYALHPVIEVSPKLRRQLVDFMPTSDLEALRALKPIRNPLRT